MSVPLLRPTTWWRPSAQPRTIPFRWRLALTSQALVLLTIVLMLVPWYVSSRAFIINAYHERLSAMALGVSAAIPADTVDALAQSTARVSVPYIAARTILREFWRAASGDSVAVSPDDGVSVVRMIGGKYVMLAHSAWPPMRPERAGEWRPPPALADSLATLRAGHTHIYWFADRYMLTAVAPVLSQNSIPSGLIVARVRADVALAAMWRQLLHLAWLPVLALVVAVLLAVQFAGQLTRRVDTLAAHAKVLAGGDLRTGVPVTSADELGVVATSLEELRAQLRILLSDVNIGAHEVMDTVHHLAQHAETMHGATREVTESARAIADVTTQQTNSVNAIATLASAAAAQAATVSSHAERSGASVHRIVESARHVSAEAKRAALGMTVIRTVTADAVPAVVELGNKSRRITSIAASIAKLANQSNVLAVNAAIEAARAGVNGRGFAVIASEVRALADSTAVALESIRSLSTEIDDSAALTSTRMQDMQKSVADGEAVMRASLQSLNRIVADAEDGREAVHEIVAVASDQHARASTVSDHVRAVALGVADNAAAVQQVHVVSEAQTSSAADVAAMSHRLAAVATQLEGTLVRFQL